MIQFVIVRNLLIVRGATRDKPFVNQIAMGCFVVYVNVLINGLVSRAFGSRPDATFMAMFAVVLLSDHLVQTFGPKKAAARTAPWQLDSAMAQ